MVLNIRRHKNQKRCRSTRVWLNSTDVTNRCIYADGRRGVVRLFKLDLRGRYFLEPTDWFKRKIEPHVAIEERRGCVKWGKINGHS